MPRMNRRAFLQNSALASIACSLPFPVGAAEHKLDRIGLQLYTVRDLAKTDFAGTLAQVAGVGYREVELAGLFDHSAKDVRGMLDQSGLTAPSGHVDYAL